MSMLEGNPVLSFLFVGFPIALVIASIWTWIRVRGIVCEIHVSGSKIALRSVHEAAAPTENLIWHYPLDVQSKLSGATITLGLEEYSLVKSDWSEWNELLQYVHFAVQSHVSETRAR